MTATQNHISSDYTARDIQVLEGIEAVRLRPGMYIGSTDQRGLHHLIYEIMDNSVDEAMAGYCDHVDIRILKDGRVRVEDNGRGIPVDVHPTTGLSALETVMTTLHAGGKFGGKAYTVTGGLHGVGASVVNALSAHLRAEIRRDGKLFIMEFQEGRLTTPLTEIDVPEEENHRTGTSVTYLADPKIFGELEFSFEDLCQRFKEMAYLNSGLKISFHSDWHESLWPNNEDTFFFEGGIASLVQHVNENREVIHKDPIYALKTVDSTIVELALQYNTAFSEMVYSFANCINTTDGGSHVTGFRAALTRVLNDYGRKQKLLRDDQPNLSGEDVREGLAAVISVKLTDPQFEGQTKTRLGNPEVKGQVEAVLGEILTIYLEDHPNEARRIIEKCVISQKARDAARKARDLVIRKNAMDGSSLPGKLADCSEQDPARSEIFLVEGESAGGSAKMGRDRKFQAILPLKGKILNVEKAREDRMIAHEEIRAMITALGAGYEPELNLAKLRYHTVIIMTDADVDGSHIRTLLLTFFFRYMRPLITSDHLYIAQPPLYRLSKGRSEEWIYTDEAKNKWMAEKAYGDLSVASTDGEIGIKGAKIMGVLDSLKAFASWSERFREFGLTAKIAKALLEHEGFLALDFADRQQVEGLKAWFEEKGFGVKRLKTDAGGEYFIDADGVAISRHLLESTAFRRGFQLYSNVKHLMNGKSFSVLKKSKEIAADTTWTELVAVLEAGADRSGLSVQRFKGLGEMNPQQLWDTTMDPETRTMLRVTLEDAALAEEQFNTLMGEEVEPRRNYIQAHALEVRNLDV